TAQATAVAVERRKPAASAPRDSTTEMVVVMPINPASTIAHSYGGSVLMRSSLRVYINMVYVSEHDVQFKERREHSVNNQWRRDGQYRTRAPNCSEIKRFGNGR